MRQQMNRERIPILQERNALQSKGRSSSSPTDPYDFDSKRDAPPGRGGFRRNRRVASSNYRVNSGVAVARHGHDVMTAVTARPA
jgi:hypothetical protein